MSAPLSEAPVYAPSGSVIAGGRFHAPAWRRAMAAGVWGPIGSHTLSMIDPEDDPAINADYPGTAVWRKYSDSGTSGGQGAMISAWNGGCYDRDLDAIWLPCGGGHGDYGGNEVYSMSLRNDSPVWTMPLPPSGSKPYIDAEGIPAGATPLGNSYLLDDGVGDITYGEKSGHYADGRPRSSHTYNKHVFLPGVGPIIPYIGGSFRGAQEPSLNGIWQLVVGESKWYMRGGNPENVGLSPGQGGFAYHKETNAIYLVGSGTSRLAKLDLATWTWSTPGTASKLEGGAQKLIAVPGESGRILQLSASGLRVWNVANGTFVLPPLLDTPTGIIDLDFYFGADWCEDLNCVVIWRGLSGSSGELLTLTPTGALTDPWQWGAITTSGTPPDGSSRGTYGRFGYSPKLKGFWVINSTTTPVWFLPLD